jgi:putative transposase
LRSKTRRLGIVLWWVAVFRASKHVRKLCFTQQNTARNRRVNWNVGMDWQARDRRRKAFNTPGHAHELTFSCYKRFQFLRAERTCNWLADAIERARKKYDFALWAYVLMPEHVHLIIFPRQADYQMRQISSGIKLPVAKRAIRFLESQNLPWLERISRKRGDRSERLFWQSGGGYDRNITCGKTLLKMIDYLHNNPVRRGLVERARDWKWSSALAFEGATSSIPIDPIPWVWLADV